MTARRFEIELPSDLSDFLLRKVEAGAYASEAEMIEVALRTLRDIEPEDTAAMRRIEDSVRDGMNSGPGKDAADVLDRLETEYRAMKAR